MTLGLTGTRAVGVIVDGTLEKIPVAVITIVVITLQYDPTKKAPNPYRVTADLRGNNRLRTRPGPKGNNGQISVW